MKQRLYITGQMDWEGKVTMDFHKDQVGQPYEWQVPLGAIEIEVPDDIIPSESTYNAMKSKHKIRCAKYRITEAEVTLNKAKESLKELLCIEHGE